MECLTGIWVGGLAHKYRTNFYISQERPLFFGIVSGEEKRFENSGDASFDLSLVSPIKRFSLSLMISKKINHIDCPGYVVSPCQPICV